MRTVWMVAAAALAASQTAASPAMAECPLVRDGDCAVSLTASLTYANSATDDRKDKLAFKMSKGESALLSDFGDPTGTTSYDLCIYADDVRVGSMSVSADGDCSDRWCWVLKSKGVAFKDKTGTPDGITAMSLAASLDVTDAKTKISVKGKGANLGDIAIPMAEPIIVQVHNSLGQCWGATFAGAEQVAQDSVKGKVKLKAKSKVFASCSDSIQNGWETAVDCGGDCDGCGYEEPCSNDADCQSGSCNAGSCGASCSDGEKNGDETSIDCGGSCGATCSYGRACLVDLDCSSGICRNGTCSEKLVFVTSTSYSANLGGTAGADAKCATRAAAANLGGTWTAWLSTSSVDAIDRIADHAYYDMFGQKMFDDKDQITTLQKPTFGISYNELKGDVFNAFAWTSTNNAGVEIASSSCLDWTSTSGFAWVGQPNLPIGWSAYGSVPCSESARLICFEQ